MFSFWLVFCTITFTPQPSSTFTKPTLKALFPSLFVNSVISCSTLKLALESFMQTVVQTTGLVIHLLLVLAAQIAAIIPPKFVLQMIKSIVDRGGFEVLSKVACEDGVVWMMGLF
jgi:uncharacterized membrane-anchored protein